MSKVASFRQADISRLIRAFTSEGLPAPAITIKNGEIRALPISAAANQDEDPDAELRRFLADDQA